LNEWPHPTIDGFGCSSVTTRQRSFGKRSICATKTTFAIIATRAPPNNGQLRDGQIAGYLVEVEYRDRDRVGDGDGVAEVDEGSSRSFLKRRSSASDAHRYWVGFNPI
jgi:hypothetical protein